MAEDKVANTTVIMNVRKDAEVMPVTGAFGGFGANDMFRVNFHYDDMKVKMRIVEGKEVLEPEGIVREVQARLVMTPQTAVSIALWMMRSLAERGYLKADQLQEGLGLKDVN